MGTPSKPSNVKIETLKPLLERLKAVQHTMTEPRNGGWSEIGTTVYDDLRNDATNEGMQGNAAQQAGDRYNDNVVYVTQANTNLKNGVDTLVGLLTAAIRKHGDADGDAANDANSTNTGAATSAAGKGK